MFDKDCVLLYFMAVLAAVVIVGSQAWATKNELDQVHRDYIAAIKMDMSDLKVGQSINLQNYKVELKSGNTNVLDVRTSDNNGLFSDLLPDNKNVVWAVATGNTTLMIHDESSDAYKIIKVHVE